MRKILVILFFFSATILFGQSWFNIGSGTISPSAASQPDMAIDGKNIPYVVFADETNSSKATVMKFDGTNWVTVGKAGFSKGKAERTSIAIDINKNVVYVAVNDAGNSNKATVWKFDGTNWVTVGPAGFSAGAAGYVCLAIDRSGFPYLAYQDGGNANYATVMKFDGTSWGVLGTIGFSQGAAASTNIAFDGNGVLYITYRDETRSASPTVMKFDGANWVLVGAAGFTSAIGSYPWIAFDQSNKPYVVFRDNNRDNKATVMKFNGTNWVTLGAAGFSDGRVDETSIVFYANTPYIIFDDFINSKIAVMKFDGTNWSYVNRTDLEDGYSGKIKITSTGIPVITYINNSVKNLTAKKNTNNQNDPVPVEKNIETPSNLELVQNYPNPFNPTTTISYSLPTSKHVLLRIYDVVGREVATLVNEPKQPGNYEVKFDGSKFASGIYFYRLQVGNFVDTKKFVLMK